MSPESPRASDVAETVTPKELRTVLASCMVGTTVEWGA